MNAASADYLSTCLQQCGGNVKRAAELAGLNRQHFYELCARHAVPIKSSRATPSNHTANILKAWRSQ